MTNGQLKRFENKVQLLRHIHAETGVSMDELWDEYDRQCGSSAENEGKNDRE